MVSPSATLSAVNVSFFDEYHAPLPTCAVGWYGANHQLDDLEDILCSQQAEDAGATALLERACSSTPSDVLEPLEPGDVSCASWEGEEEEDGDGDGSGAGAWRSHLAQLPWLRVPSMPSLPALGQPLWASLPSLSLSMPNLSMPSLSVPSLSMPFISLHSMLPGGSGGGAADTADAANSSCACQPAAAEASPALHEEGADALARPQGGAFSIFAASAVGATAGGVFAGPWGLVLGEWLVVGSMCVAAASMYMHCLLSTSAL